LRLSKASKTMWDQILRIFRDILDKAETSYLSKAKSFNCTEEENKTSLATLRKRAWQVLRAKIDEQTAEPVILGKLRNHFEERFRYDEQGVPRVWKPDDDIDGAFKKAKDQTLELVPLYSKIIPADSTLEFMLPSETSDSLSGTDEFDFDSTLVIFTETKSLELTNKLRKDADAYYVEAKRSTVSGVAQIPYWIYGVLIVLGWNEAMTVLFNPLYFTFLLIVLAASYIIVQLGMVGPLLRVLHGLVGELQRQATARLREHFSQPMLLEPVPASQNGPIQKDGSQDIELEELRRRQS